MTLQQLQYFLAAFRHGSFSAAAEELHLAQPSLSEQVRRLEAELGVRLFQRVGRGVTPTEAGHTLRPHAERTLDAAEAARDSVVAVRELRGGTATFGTWGTARYYPGVDFVAEFRRRHPSVRVRVVGLNSSEVVEAVRAGELEAGMVSLPIDDRGLDVQPIMREEIVYASSDPVRVRTPVTIESLGSTSLILSDASYGAEDPMRRQLAEMAQRVGVSIQPQIDVEDIEAAHRARGTRPGGHDRLARDPARDGQAGVQAPGLGAVRRSVLHDVRLRGAGQRAAVAGLARVPLARARASRRAGPGAAHRAAAPARPWLTWAIRGAARRCRRAGGAAGRRPPWG